MTINKQHRYVLSLLTAVISFCVIAEQPDTATAAGEKEAIPLEEIRVLVEVFHKIKNDYVEPISDRDLLENAMRGMLAGLDPHSAYLDEEDYKGLQEGTTGEFGGLGIEVGSGDGFIKVIAPIDDTPAARAGIRAGDLIVRLDDTPIKGMSLHEAVRKMRGKPGTAITLTVIRQGEEAPLKISITRDIITVRSVRSRMLDPGFAYVRISQFQSATGDDLHKHLRDLKRAAGGKLKGVILDLRNNPGGILGTAVSVSDAFLTSGKIVYTDGRVKDARLEFIAKPPDLIDGAPLLVLVNEGSASASEIVAGALQDHRRAVIMGRKTFGKGSVQTILPMNNHTALKLTTARYYTPSGRSIQAEGITPDIVIDKVKVSSITVDEDNSVKEAQLLGHLENDEPKTEPGKGESSKEPGKEEDAEGHEQPLAESDYELYEALNLLKGMVLLQARTEAQ